MSRIAVNKKYSHKCVEQTNRTVISLKNKIETSRKAETEKMKEGRQQVGERQRETGRKKEGEQTNKETRNKEQEDERKKERNRAMQREKRERTSSRSRENSDIH